MYATTQATMSEGNDRWVISLKEKYKSSRTGAVDEWLMLEWIEYMISV